MIQVMARGTGSPRRDHSLPFEEHARSKVDEQVMPRRRFNQELLMGRIAPCKLYKRDTHVWDEALALHSLQQVLASKAE